ncbi:glycerate kinase [Candidatus Sumerlaeota bacterium]|nr:glycerate kinase [Candidatus Sumerlaeota bacterium]
MKIVLAPNAFKESLTAGETARAMAQGVHRAMPDAQTVLCPMADGGDGSAEAMLAACVGRWIRRKVQGPLGDPVMGRYAWLESERTAFIEMAEVSGLRLLSPKQRNPLKTSTYGTGQLIADALDRGARRVLVGIGGSATVDCGCGMAQALGAKLLDAKGNALKSGGGALSKLARVDLSGLHPVIAKTKIEAACDVTNPLTGKQGGIQVYSPQKGATPRMLEALEAGAKNFARVVRRDLGPSVGRIPGAGAAGGLGAGLIAFLNAELRPGAELIADAVRLDERLQGASLVITGEGKIDGQTRFGKAPAEVMRRAKAAGIPCVALCGAIGDNVNKLRPIGMTSVHSICDAPMPLEHAMRNAKSLLRNAAENLIRLWLSSR